MDIEHQYAFNQRHYHLSPTSDGWQITYVRLEATPIHQTFSGYEAAHRAYWRRIACAILLNPRRLRGADINGTFIALVSDTDGRVHLAQHTESGPDSATWFTNRLTALTTWRDRCWELAHNAAYLPLLTTDPTEKEAL